VIREHSDTGLVLPGAKFSVSYLGQIQVGLHFASGVDQMMDQDRAVYLKFNRNKKDKKTIVM
jgi:hypothetical protein